MARKSNNRAPRGRHRDEGKKPKRGCMYCEHGVEQVDYKEYTNLRAITTDKGKIKGQRTTGLCRRHQNQAQRAVKRAREVALLPYVAR